MEDLAASVVLGASLVWSATILSAGLSVGLERVGVQTIDHWREHGPRVVCAARPQGNVANAGNIMLPANQARARVTRGASNARAHACITSS